MNVVTPNESRAKKKRNNTYLNSPKQCNYITE